MHIPEGVEFRPLPGSDALKIAPLFQPGVPLPYDTMRPYYEPGGYRGYLRNDAYDRYVQMPKALVGEESAEQLQEVAQLLETEELPTLLGAAASAYFEASLPQTRMSAVERVDLVKKAQTLWARSIVNTVNMSEVFESEYPYNDNGGHRTAINLASVPLMKSLIVGNVRPDVMQNTLLDIAEIAHDSRVLLESAYKNKKTDVARFHRGFLYEAIALMTVLHIGDPRCVPLPSTAKAGAGYYHREQTHDIAIVYHHWGDIDKVIPVEIKSTISESDKQRYKALIVSGKMRLSIDGASAMDTADAFYGIAHGTATPEQIDAVKQLSDQFQDMLELYQQGVSIDDVAKGGLTRFYDSRKVAEQYPELS